MRHALYPTKIGSTVLPAIQSDDLSTGTEIGGEPTGGQIFANARYITAQNPSANFTALAIATWLNTIKSTKWPTGLMGMAISPTNVLALYTQKREDGGDFAASGHQVNTINKGIIAPQSLSVGHQEDATITYAAQVAWDGNNNPIVPSTTSSLPTLPAGAERFTLGPSTVAGVTLTPEDIQRIELEFGLTLETKGGGSELWPREAYITAGQMNLRITGSSPAWFAATGAFPLKGNKGLHADTKAYLRKRDSTDDAGFIPDGTAQHIMLTANGLAYIDKPQGASGRGDHDTTLVIDMYSDAVGNAPLGINTASAIT